MRKRRYFALTAYDSDRDDVDDQTEGNESWFSEDVEAVIGQPPQAGFSAAPTSGMRPLTVTFTHQSTGNFDTCAWLFGDGGSSTACSDLTHTYMQAGCYDVTLTVSGPAGSGTEVKAGYITANPIPVEADFSAAPISGAPPLEVHFTNQSSGDYTACTWDFGDGRTSGSCDNQAHTYTLPKLYTAGLQVSGPGGTDSQVKIGLIEVQTWFEIFVPLAQK